MAIKCRKTKTSKGERRSVAQKTPLDAFGRTMAKVIAKKKGNKVATLVYNKESTNRAYTRVVA